MRRLDEFGNGVGRMQERLIMLVVDDVAVNRASFKAMFEQEYEVLEASDGKAALEVLRSQKVDVVILDVFMPIMDGNDVLGQMKADAKLRDIPVIVKTAIDENIEVEMLERGADDFIFSPCEPAIVINRVRNIVERYGGRKKQLEVLLEEERHLSMVREHLLMRTSQEAKDDVCIIEDLCRMETAKCDPALKEILEKIRERAGHVRKMAESILDGQVVGEDEAADKKDPFQLQGVIAETTGECRAICERKGIFLHVNGGDIFCDNLIGDGRRLKQVWSRLLEKAYANTAPGGSICTSYAQRISKTDEIELEIAVRGSIDSREEYPIIKSLVELMRGSMEVKSESNKQILCTITLPFGIGKETLIQKRNFGCMKTIILDDNEVTRDYHAALLTRLGVSCDMVGNIADAMRLLKRAYLQGRGYDICFLNWYMPGGEEAVREIRSICPPGRMVLTCSTNEKEQIEERMLFAGVDYVMQRPIYHSAMYHFLTEVCKRGLPVESA